MVSQKLLGDDAVYVRRSILQGYSLQHVADLEPGPLWVKHPPVLAAMCVWGSPTGHMMHTHRGRDVQLPRNSIQRVYCRGDKCDHILR